jgi:hypothetical protein
MVAPFCSDFSKNINFLRKRSTREVNRSIIQVGFQLFGDVPHCLLRKESVILPPEIDTNLWSYLSAVISPKILTF